MNLEFQSATKPTLNGVRGISKNAENASTQHTKGQERSAQFRDLLNQSKQEIKQADRQLEKTRENRKASESTAQSNQQEKEQSLSDVSEVRSDESPSGKVEELKDEGSQVNDLIPTLDPSLLIGVQNVQGDKKTAVTGLGLNLGQEETTPADLISQEQVIPLIDSSKKAQDVSVLKGVAEFEQMENVKVLSQNPDKVENQETEDLLEVLSGTKPEVEVTKEVSSKVDFSQQLVGKTNLNDDTKQQTAQGIEPMEENQIATEKAATVINGKADSEQQTAQGIEPKEENQIATEKAATVVNGKADSDLAKETGLEQTKTVDVQKSAINQTENQNPGERGVQDLSSMGVSSNKGPEVGHSAKVEVAQQVEQKIIQNFEPAKPMTLQMTLSPDNLGDIDIKLSYNQGKLIIDIMAASSETQKLLGNQINQLVRGLALQNVQVETVHLNTPVEATENGESMGSLLNDGSQFSQQQNNAPLKEQFLSKGTIQNNAFSNGAQDSNDELISLAQNLQYNGQRRINYLV
ncbi:flagellar hook-length control protein FliK [Acetobacterium sp. K1/6]|uniref:flagellar hook-length control protein FliK n=1 Tax=Acetobacterium sp. K1/6 TaxID=3055467 RepID=UPI002ACA6D89|nr:flagellar hook-length control protein FliK [Acetobacterium sp. K1/6]MDZ5724864.1 flagellar hook-length control protein FliK [Acetobacterium sp. K1/6]